jgi:hypothetical protein
VADCVVQTEETDVPMVEGVVTPEATVVQYVPAAHALEVQSTHVRSAVGPEDPTAAPEAAAL